MKSSNGVFVQVIGHHNAGAGGTQDIELVAHLSHDGGQVTRVNPHRPEVDTRHLDGLLDGGFDIERVDQKCRVLPQGVQLSPEGLFF